ncbi:magnesium-dependent phosphatase-1 [Scheffersomyces coipomensis]|uniref:magnesium-dependent phosphatase-1 n=1 Tax=Scheffersomyces coipomensis TaxID=1788519 RepID=UPI00315D63B9
MTIKRYPKAVVFDLDYTLWPCWCDTHITMPIKAVSDSQIIDRSGMKLGFFKDVESIILELIDNNVKIIGASRTAAPYIAEELLSLLHISNTPAIKYFDSLQWGTGSKVKHITKAAKQLNMELELKEGEFILFDDELRNRDVRSINCHFGHVFDEDEGLTRNIFLEELKLWEQSITTGEFKESRFNF